MTTNNDSLPDFGADSKDPFIDYGPGGRSPDNASIPAGVESGEASNVAEASSWGSTEAARQAASAPKSV